MVRQFIAHQSSGKARIFALVNDSRDRLEAITTLSAEDLHLTDDIVDELNTFLTERDTTSLSKVLSEAPEPVRIAVERFVRDRCTAQPEAPDRYRSTDLLRRVFFLGSGLDEVEEHLDAAYTLGLGIRLSNTIRDDGDTEWVLELYHDELFVPASGELRTWPLPPGVEVLQNWNSRDNPRSLLDTAIGLAAHANQDGCWVRLHSLMYGDGEDEFDCTSTSEYVLDVLDAPVPKAEDE